MFAAIGALSHEHERAFSASIIYLGLGAGAAVVIQLAGVDWIDPLEDESLIERLTELAVIIALFGTGLKLDRPLNRESWGGVARLLIVAMPLTIGAVALFGTQVMGLSLGAAIVLGAMLAPTDPVLAGDIGVGPPGDEDEHEPNFSITGEAGLNDGLALPFLFLGLFVADEGGTGWLGEWLVADVVYAIGVAVVIGAAVGYGIGALAVNLRDRRPARRGVRPVAGDPDGAADLRPHRGRGRVRVRGGIRRRRRAAPLRARPREQQAHPRRRRVGREVRRARGRAGARQHAHHRRPRGARLQRLAAGPGAAPGDPPARGRRGHAALQHARPRARLRRLVRGARRRLVSTTRR